MLLLYFYSCFGTWHSHSCSCPVSFSPSKLLVAFNLGICLNPAFRCFTWAVSSASEYSGMLKVPLSTQAENMHLHKKGSCLPATASAPQSKVYCGNKKGSECNWSQKASLNRRNPVYRLYRSVIIIIVNIIHFCIHICLHAACATTCGCGMRYIQHFNSL